MLNCLSSNRFLSLTLFCSHDTGILCAMSQSNVCNTTHQRYGFWHLSTTTAAITVTNEVLYVSKHWTSLHSALLFKAIAKTAYESRSRVVQRIPTTTTITRKCRFAMNISYLECMWCVVCVYGSWIWANGSTYNFLGFGSKANATRTRSLKKKLKKRTKKRCGISTHMPFPVSHIFARDLSLCMWLFRFSAFITISLVRSIRLFHLSFGQEVLSGNFSTPHGAFSNETDSRKHFF